nr:VanW family protein [Nocardioides flavescens]
MRRRVKRRGVGHEAEGGRAVLVIVLALLLLAGGGWVAAYAGASGNLPRGTTIAGVAVGGQDRYQAARTLAAGVQSELDAPLTLQVGTTTTQVTPAEAGLSVDAVASVAQALGPRSWDPEQLWGYYSGGSDLEPVVSVDAAAMDALLTKVEGLAGEPARDGGVDVTSGRIELKAPREGATLDRAQASAAVVAAFSAGRHELSLPLLYTVPEIDQADVDQAVATLANPALAAPVTLVFATGQVTLGPQDYADVLQIVPRDGALALQVDPTLVTSLVDPAAYAVAPVDASLSLATGAPTVVPAVDGQTYDAAAVATALQQAVVATGDARTVTVPSAVAPATVQAADIEALGVRELVSTFGVPVPATAGATLTDAVGRLDGAVVRPGETFSLAGRIGDARGEGDRLATAVWNAGSLAGLVDVSRTAPTSWSAGLPEGRDAAYAVGGPDLQLRDDGTAAVLLSARVADGAVTVDVWSTKEFDVALTVGARYAGVARATVADANPTCVAQAGEDGFSVDLVRTVSRVGDPTPVRSDTVTTTYAPVAAVVCQPAAQ